MDSIKKKLEESKNIPIEYVDYFTRLGPMIEQKYPKEYKKIGSIINKLETLYDDAIEIKNISGNEAIHNMLMVYIGSTKFYTALDQLDEILSQDYLNADTIAVDEFSRTFKLETTDKLEQISIKYNNIKKKYAASDEMLLEYMTDKILHYILEKDELERFNFLRDIFKRNPVLVGVYARIVQNIIDTTHNKTLMFQILNMIEEDKSEILQGAAKSRLSKLHAHDHVSSIPYRKFSLVPSTKSMSLKNLIMLASGVSGNVNITTLTKDACVIMLYRVVEKPIEYLSIPSIDKTRGVTTKNVIQSKIINMLPDAKFNFKHIIKGKTSSKKFYIFETLDSIHWRALTPWTDGVLYMSHFRIKSFLDHITNANKPSRPTNYHAIMVKKAVSNMFLERNLSEDVIENHSKEIDIHVMKNKLYLTLNNVVTKLCKKKKIRSHADINDVIHHIDITNTFETIILEMYKIGTELAITHEYSAGKFPCSELLATYIGDLHKLKRRFSKELHDKYNRDPISQNINNDVAQKRIMEDIAHILDILITPTSNIYSVLSYKHLQLNFH